MVPGKGSDEPTIMFVGLAPSWADDKDGECFVGKPGKKLMELLTEAEIDLDTCRFTNMVRCIPWKVKDKKTRDPTAEEVITCGDYLMKEIALYDPDIIVPLGKLPTVYFLPHLTDKVKITKISGIRYNWVR